MASFPSSRIWPVAAGVVLLLGACGVMAMVRGGASGTIPPPVPLPSPNGFDRYVGAAAAIVPARPPVDKINDSRALTPAQAASAYAPARRAAWIAANSGAWTLFSSAKTLPARHPNLRGSTANFPAWKMLRDLARCQSIRVKDLKSRGQWAAAMDGGLDTLQMGRAIEHGAPLVGALVGMAVEHIGEYSIKDVPAHLTAPEARRRPPLGNPSRHKPAVFGSIERRKVGCVDALRHLDWRHEQRRFLR